MDSNDSVQIRPATPADYDEVCTMFHALDAHHVQLAPREYTRFDGPARPHDHYLSLVTSNDTFFFVAERDGALIGFTNGHIGEAPPYPMFRPRRYVEVVNLFVDSAQRGTGLGPKLLKQAMNWGDARGTNALRLDVVADNQQALRFYERLGFRLTRAKMELTALDLE